MSEQVNNDVPARVEQDGRVLTGGPSVEALEAVMERHAPETETPEPAPSPAPGEPPPPDPNQPKQSRGAKRFEALTAERETAKREAAAERERREALEREVADLRRQSDERNRPAQRPAQAAVPTAPQPTRPKPVEDEVGTKYQTYADFVEDLSDWKTEQRMAGIDLNGIVTSRIEAYRQQQQMTQTVGQTYERGRSKFQDFDQIIGNGPGVDVLLGPTEAKGNERIAEILHHPHAEHILYAIARDATVAQQLATLSDIQFGYALSRIVSTDPAVAQPASTRIPSPVIAPAPYQPVGSGSKTTVSPSAELVKKGGFDFDKSGYRERRAAERGVRRR